VRLLVVTQGEWGQRIADHIRRTAPAGWQVAVWRGPAVLPVVLDEPDEFLPDVLPRTDLLLVLTESASMTDLAPDIARLCGAQAVLVPVDKRSWARPGLRRQVEQRLHAMDVAGAMPMPFCSLVPSASQHPLLREFAQRYGRPELDCTLRDGHVTFCQVLRETPCGNTRYIVERLVGVPAEKAAQQAGLLHHYYPCWGGMEVDPVLGSHTLLHIAATMAQKSVERTLKKGSVHGRPDPSEPYSLGITISCDS
jgi:thymidylate synthase